MKAILIFSLLFSLASAYKVLGVFPWGSKSHYAIGNAVMNSLLEAGHEVVMITPFPRKQSFPNYRDISVVDIMEKMQKGGGGPSPFTLGKLNPGITFPFLHSMGAQMSTDVLSHPKIQELMNSGEKFDAVVVEIFNNDALLGLAQHFGCPVIGVTTYGVVKWVDAMTSNPSPYSYVPNPCLGLVDKMSFTERLSNTFYSLIESFFYHVLYVPQQTKIFNKFFPSSQMTFKEVLKSPSIVLMNSHVSSSAARPFLPNIIEIGGIHVEPVKELPKDIQDYLDSAENGVIYFSMGSYIQSKDWTVEKREALTKAFGKLKQKVLWKYENETLPGNPGNIMIGSWLPQRDILAHPNVKAFITHGGLLGTTEALVEGVPVLGLPIFGDQKMNMAKAQTRGYGLVLDYDDISEESITEKLAELLRNPKYKINAQEISRRYSDRPITPKRAASFWIEYAIRHKGAKHLNAAGNSLNYFQFHLIDVYATLFFFLMIVLSVNFVMFRAVFRKIFKSKSKVVQKKMSKKN